MREGFRPEEHAGNLGAAFFLEDFISDVSSHRGRRCPCWTKQLAFRPPNIPKLMHRHCALSSMGTHVRIVQRIGATKLPEFGKIECSVARYQERMTITRSRHLCESSPCKLSRDLQLFSQSPPVLVLRLRERIQPLPATYKPKTS